MFHQFRLFIYQYYLRKQLKEQVIEHEVVAFDKARNIGVLFDITDKSQLTSVNQFVHQLERANKKVHLLGFASNDESTDDLLFPCFSQKETSWFYQPKGEQPIAFMEKPFDILVCTFFEESAVLEYMAALSKARFRVGPYFENKQHCFDFMVNHDNDSLKDFFKHVYHYLTILKN